MPLDPEEFDAALSEPVDELNFEGVVDVDILKREEESEPYEPRTRDHPGVEGYYVVNTEALVTVKFSNAGNIPEEGLGEAVRIEIDNWIEEIIEDKFGRDGNELYNDYNINGYDRSGDEVTVVIKVDLTRDGEIDFDFDETDMAAARASYNQLVRKLGPNVARQIRI